jgi:hypothetical protein
MSEAALAGGQPAMYKNSLVVLVFLMSCVSSQAQQVTANETPKEVPSTTVAFSADF